MARRQAARATIREHDKPAKRRVDNSDADPRPHDRDFAVGLVPYSELRRLYDYLSAFVRVDTAPAPQHREA
jgi:hypothetical protein